MSGIYCSRRDIREFGATYLSWIGCNCSSNNWWVWGFNTVSNIYFVLGLVETVLAVISIKRNWI